MKTTLTILTVAFISCKPIAKNDSTSGSADTEALRLEAAEAGTETFCLNGKIDADMLEDLAEAKEVMSPSAFQKLNEALAQANTTCEGDNFTDEVFVDDLAMKNINTLKIPESFDAEIVEPIPSSTPGAEQTPFIKPTLQGQPQMALIGTAVKIVRATWKVAGEFVEIKFFAKGLKNPIIKKIPKAASQAQVRALTQGTLSCAIGAMQLSSSNKCSAVTPVVERFRFLHNYKLSKPTYSVAKNEMKQVTLSACLQNPKLMPRLKEEFAGHFFKLDPKTAEADVISTLNKSLFGKTSVNGEKYRKMMSQFQQRVIEVKNSGGDWSETELQQVLNEMQPRISKTMAQIKKKAEFYADEVAKSGPNPKRLALYEKELASDFAYLKEWVILETHLSVLKAKIVTVAYKNDIAQILK